jgi:RimJ/RimL family protein N-acetyltransferase
LKPSQSNTRVFLETKRLRLRQWVTGDLEPFSDMNQDPVVMEYFPGLIPREQSKSFVDKTHSLIEKQGYGLWAAEEIRSGEFIGFVGLSRPIFHAHFTPCLEIGWRLAHQFWGRGLAAEGAMAALAFAFDMLDEDEVVSFTADTNSRSIRVMQKIGMTEDVAGRFIHPALPKSHSLAPHCLYRINRTS